MDRAALDERYRSRLARPATTNLSDALDARRLRGAVIGLRRRGVRNAGGAFFQPRVNPTRR